MSTLAKIEKEINQLSPDEFQHLADWIAEQRELRWDRQIGADGEAGKLDKLAQQALADHRAGRSSKI